MFTNKQKLWRLPKLTSTRHGQNPTQKFVQISVQNMYFLSGAFKVHVKYFSFKSVLGNPDRP